ncbi:MAG: tetratricopeptide repeat protein [Candidatus Mcinerneyibacterium aminivorans]|uniref:Tetratricopeptide repeat protein n=1 Tax=Candidatus Mcinerneyibacterium aminivorans TaxID=2703815 RepID=A0A5D0MIA0_9BACT|nr:MAG: tetratricopeptide repeat protein [Candidatus Mcinerneyibacterium aminivorans]
MKKKIILITAAVVFIFTGCSKEFNSNIKRGRRALNNNKLIDAIGYFENATKLKPEEPKGYYWLAMAYKEKMRYGNFVINMNKTMIYGKKKYKEDIADAYYEFAKELEKNNRIETMYDAFERLLEIDPDYKIEEDYAIHLGNKYYEDEYDYKKALEFYKNVENTELPDEMKKTILYRIAYCHYQLGNYVTANKYYNMILEEYPNHPKLKTIYYNIGKINFQLAQKAFNNKNYGEAIVRGETVLKIGKPKLWLSEIHRILGDSYLEKDNKEKALEMYNKIVENDPYRSHKDTLYALKKIKELKK